MMAFIVILVLVLSCVFSFAACCAIAPRCISKRGSGRLRVQSLEALPVHHVSKSQETVPQQVPGRQQQPTPHHSESRSSKKSSQPLEAVQGKRDQRTHHSDHQPSKGVVQVIPPPNSIWTRSATGQSSRPFSSIIPAFPEVVQICWYAYVCSSCSGCVFRFTGTERGCGCGCHWPRRIKEACPCLFSFSWWNSSYFLLATCAICCVF